MTFSLASRSIPFSSREKEKVKGNKRLMATEVDSRGSEIVGVP